MSSIWNLAGHLARPKAASSKSKLNQTAPAFYAAVVQFVYNCRLVTGDQIQRRFPHYFKSDRSRRRHLQTMTDDFGYLGCLRPTITAPNIFFALPSGLNAIKDAYANQGISWEADTKHEVRNRGRAIQNLRHELITSEMQLNFALLTQHHKHLKLNWQERRFFTPDKQLIYPQGSRQRVIIPDLGTLFSVTTANNRRGQIICFVEVDCGSESLNKITNKFQAYTTWANSTDGQEYLTDLYTQHGANNPKPNFRLLLVISVPNPARDDLRLQNLLLPTLELDPTMRRRLWLTTGDGLQHELNDQPILTNSVWIKAQDCELWIPEYQQLSHRSVNKLQALRRQFVAEKINDLPKYQLFPETK